MAKNKFLIAVKLVFGELLAGYLFSIWLTHLIFLTFVSFFAFRSQESLHKIDEVVRANQVSIYGLAALFFCTALHMLHPLTKTSVGSILSFKDRLSKILATTSTTVSTTTWAAIWKSALGGAILSIVLLAGTLLSGHITWLGFYTRFDEVALTIASALIFAASYYFFSIVEEYILRQSLEPYFQSYFKGTTKSAAFTALIFVLIKHIQFDLEWLEAINFFLFSLILSSIVRQEKTHLASASFSTCFFIVSHILFGLPFLGEDTPRFFLFRASNTEPLTHLLSGGASGPESSLVLTVLLGLYLYLPHTPLKLKGALPNAFHHDR